VNTPENISPGTIFLKKALNFDEKIKKHCIYHPYKSKIREVA